MVETLLDELKRYVKWTSEDEQALRELHPYAAPHFQRISVEFYDRILEHDQAKKALEGGESQVGRLKITLVAWMDSMLKGPWDDAYYERRARIGRVHVKIALPQHYMFGAMNVVRQEMLALIQPHPDIEWRKRMRSGLEKILDIELAIMLHTYREDLLSQQAKVERLSTFGQLVGSIGHELRNPLGVMESSLYILKGRLPEDERARKHVERIGQQLGLANDIITKLLDLIRDRPLTRIEVKLDTLVAAAAQAVSWAPEVKFEIDGLDALPAVFGDGAHLRQVFVNLLENANQSVAASGGGHVWVRGTILDTQVQLRVEDDGPGVSPEVKARLFEPLVTGKPKGIGLGLPLVKRIIERHGGSIVYRPREGGGASFIITLPGAPS